MRCILIDPDHRTMSYIDIDENQSKLEQFYQHMECSLITSPIDFQNGDTLYVDDEGLFYVNPDTTFFRFRGYHHTLCGKGVIVGIDQHGNSVDCSTTIEELQQLVEFVEYDNVTYPNYLFV